MVIIYGLTIILRKSICYRISRFSYPLLEGTRYCILFIVVAISIVVISKELVTIVLVVRLVVILTARKKTVVILIGT